MDFYIVLFTMFSREDAMQAIQKPDAVFDHGVVNHRLNYRDPETGVHTNRIEGNWGALKQFLRRQRATHRNWTEAYVHEYCFRRNIVDSFYTCWRRIIEAQLETRG